MPNRYCDLTPSKKIQDDFEKISAGFDRVQAEMDAKVNANRIINGNFDVWQRGTSFVTNTGYIADRWNIGAGADTGTLPTVTHTRQSLTTGDILGSFYYYRQAVGGAGTTGPSQSYTLTQRIEGGVRNLCGLGKKVTVSFWARSNIPGKKLGIDITTIFGTGGSPTPVEFLTGTNWTLASTWTKYTFTFTTNTIAGKTFGTNGDDSLNVNLWTAWGTSYGSRVGNSGGSEAFSGAGNIDIAQVQLCAGDVSLPNQPRSFAEELSLCQRYFQVYGGATNRDSFGTGVCLAANSAIIPIRYPQMRISPTILFTAASTFEVVAGSVTSVASSLVANDTTQTSSVISFVAATSSFTAGQAALLRQVLGNVTTIKLDAEL